MFVNKIWNYIQCVKRKNIGKKFRKFGDSVVESDLALLNPQRCQIGDSCYIGKDSILQCYTRYPLYQTEKGTAFSPTLSIGSRVSATRRLTIYCALSVIIEDDVLIGSDVLITDENHGLDATTVNYADNELSQKPVNICKGVWIGDKVIILPGVTIGTKSVIGAGSIVTHDVPAYSIAVGNPAKVIKRWNPSERRWIRNE